MLRKNVFWLIMVTMSAFAVLSGFYIVMLWFEHSGHAERTRLATFFFQSGVVQDETLGEVPSGSSDWGTAFRGARAELLLSAEAPGPCDITLQFELSPWPEPTPPRVDVLVNGVPAGSWQLRQRDHHVLRQLRVARKAWKNDQPNEITIVAEGGRLTPARIPTVARTTRTSG